jgi:CubicO group peptidase (beta-lactamase class C family)
MKFIFVFLCSFFLFSCTQDISEIEVKSEVGFHIDSILNERNFNGVIQIQKNGQTIYQKCKGFTDFEAETNLSLNNQFVIGSVSKQITAVIVLQFYEDGKLSLNDTIGMYFPNLNKDWKNQVTIHQLLSHTHGIISLTEELEFQPSTQFHYSQFGYHLLAQILERISNQSFEDLTSELFLKNNLKNTFHPNSDEHDLVKGYESIQDTLIEMITSLQNYPAAGSMISNSSDLLKWNELLYNNGLLKKETFDVMKTRYATRVHPIYGEVEYGYGLLFVEGESEIQIGALGYAPGFVSSCYYFPKSKYNVVMLENVAQDIPDFKSCFRTQIKVLNLIKELK